MRDADAENNHDSETTPIRHRFHRIRRTYEKPLSE